MVTQVQKRSVLSDSLDWLPAHFRLASLLQDDDTACRVYAFIWNSYQKTGWGKLTIKHGVFPSRTINSMQSMKYYIH